MLMNCLSHATSLLDIGVARILSAGVHFFAKKVGRPFFSRRCLNIPPNLSHPAKIDSCSAWWGCTSCPAGGALTHFPCKLGLKIFFNRPGGCRCTHCTPWLRPPNLSRSWLEAYNTAAHQIQQFRRGYFGKRWAFKFQIGFCYFVVFSVASFDRLRPLLVAIVYPVYWQKTSLSFVRSQDLYYPHAETAISEVPEKFWHRNYIHSDYDLRDQ